MNFKVLIPIAAASSVLAISGCEIEKTEDGEMPDVDVQADAGQMPKYDVDVRKTQDGRMPDVDVDVEGGKLPQYDVDGPDVDVHMEEKTIKVPDVDVDYPDDDPDEIDPEDNDEVEPPQ
jgi:hypothetical protein